MRADFDGSATSIRHGQTGGRRRPGVSWLYWAVGSSGCPQLSLPGPPRIVRTASVGSSVVSQARERPFERTARSPSASGRLSHSDRAPSAFLVYLWLWRQTHAQGRANVGASLQDIARATGLSKSSVQNAVRRLKRRRLLAAEYSSPTAAPIYRVNETWKR